MTFKNIVLRNEKLLFLTLAILVFMETISYAVAGSKGLLPNYSRYMAFQIIYFHIWVYWSYARVGTLKTSFDKGFFYWIIYPIFIFYSCLKQFGKWKGSGLFLLIFIGAALPEIVYQILLDNYYY
jgi:hypothetical protein